ncbi:hypothetical protein FGB62_48g11 [Gracilaria domingensis]|nr:hypothetical protein FGB62_48g11 [Gracilaria domingensis]
MLTASLPRCPRVPVAPSPPHARTALPAGLRAAFKTAPSRSGAAPATVLSALPPARLPLHVPRRRARPSPPPRNAMAGGRRPSSYVSGARHGSAIDRQSVHESHTSPPLASTTGPSLPPWIPSIWQPAPVQSPTARVVRDKQTTVDPSSVLAAALDTAVQSAVERALGAAPPAAVSTSQLTASSSNSENGAEDESSQPLTQREIELLDLVGALRVRLQQRDDDIASLQQRMGSLEHTMQRYQTATQTHHQRVDATTSNLAKQISDATLQLDNRLDARFTSVNDQIRSTQNSVSRLANHDGDVAHLYARSRQLTSELFKFRTHVSTELEKQASKTKQFEQSFKTITDRLTSIAADASASNPDVEQLRRNVQSATESLATVRSKLKRVETQIGEVSKQAEDSVALSGAFEEGIRVGLDDITKTVASLHCTVREIKKNLPPNPEEANPTDASNTELKAKVDSLETNLKALKRLIESNLRTQWSAESIVKEQVSLITKHVCVAMRQYTARRISENNALIDKALRARIPEYAKNNDQFVLVREEDLEGNESVGIHRSSHEPTPVDS